MYAIIASGGKQYRVAPGDVIKVEKLETDAGNTIVFDKVLLVNTDQRCDIGAPYVEGSKVEGKALAHGRAKKIEVVKFLRRKRHTRRKGHRQEFTQVEITGIK